MACYCSHWRIADYSWSDHSQVNVLVHFNVQLCGENAGRDESISGGSDTGVTLTWRSLSIDEPQRMRRHRCPAASTYLQLRLRQHVGCEQLSVSSDVIACQLCYPLGDVWRAADELLTIACWQLLLMPAAWYCPSLSCRVVTCNYTHITSTAILLLSLLCSLIARSAKSKK